MVLDLGFGFRRGDWVFGSAIASSINVVSGRGDVGPSCHSLGYVQELLSAQCSSRSKKEADE
jgi:hypothetical protein